MNDTLAISNLARALLGAGFVDEADAECRKAQATEGYHEGIDNVLSLSKTRPADEEEKLKKLLEEPTALKKDPIGSAMIQ